MLCWTKSIQRLQVLVWLDAEWNIPNAVVWSVEQVHDSEGEFGYLCPVFLAFHHKWRATGSSLWIVFHLEPYTTMFSAWIAQNWHFAFCCRPLCLTKVWNRCDFCFSDFVGSLTKMDYVVVKSYQVQMAARMFTWSCKFVANERVVLRLTDFSALKLCSGCLNSCMHSAVCMCAIAIWL
jgi:hypothetical protein